MIPQPCVYVGRVYHRRLRPREHKLSYRCYWLFLDLDLLETWSKRLRFFSVDKFNLFSLKNADHGTGAAHSFRVQAEAQFREAGIDMVGAKIFLLTMPRILGYGFNPISIYYCYHGDGTLAALMYQVHNTFGQRHSYLVVTDPGTSDVHQSCDKKFYVSPFLEMDLSYDFQVTHPAERIDVAIHVSDSDGLLLTASLTGQHRQLSDGTLLRLFVTHPLVTLKVIGAIHWEALRLWWKGVRLVPRPDPPEQPATIQSTHKTTRALHES